MKGHMLVQPKRRMRHIAGWTLFFSSIVSILVMYCGVHWYTHLQRPPRFPITNQTSAIVFTTDRDRGEQLYVIYPDGSHETRLTYLVRKSGTWWWPSSWGPFLDLVNNIQPQPAPIGEGVVYLSNVEGDYAFYQIRLGGSEPIRLPTPNSVLGNPNAKLSPNGQRIAYITHEGALAVINRDGTDERCLTCNTGKRTSTPSWSPNGQYLVFAMDEVEGTNLYRINSDGTNLHQLTNTPGARNGAPAWNPKGEYIAFSSTRDRGQSEVYIMNADGSGQRRLTTSGSDDAPAWSPDGQRITFESGREGQWLQIYVMNSDGSAQTQVTKDVGNKYTPAWISLAGGQ